VSDERADYADSDLPPSRITFEWLANTVIPISMAVGWVGLLVAFFVVLFLYAPLYD
jgi:hypothetical protein